MKKANEEYSNEIDKLESDLDKLNITIVKQQQVVSNSASSSNNSSSGSSSSNSSNGASSSVGTVYANGGSSTSNKYHRYPTAHNMEGAIPMSESESKSKGYVACKKCY